MEKSTKENKLKLTNDNYWFLRRGLDFLVDDDDCRAYMYGAFDSFNALLDLSSEIVYEIS